MFYLFCIYAPLVRFQIQDEGVVRSLWLIFVSPRLCTFPHNENFSYSWRAVTQCPQVLPKRSMLNLLCKLGNLDVEHDYCLVIGLGLQIALMLFCSLMGDAICRVNGGLAEGQPYGSATWTVIQGPILRPFALFNALLLLH